MQEANRLMRISPIRWRMHRRWEARARSSVKDRYGLHQLL